MSQKILITGAFDDARYQFGFFEQIAAAIETMGHEVRRFNAFGFNAAQGSGAKALERCFTVPARLLGVRKESVRGMLPWTNENRREQALLAAVREFRPQVMIVITGHRHRAATLRQCRRLGVRRVIGWYVEGPIELGVPEGESLMYDEYFCIHRELAQTARERIRWLPSYALDKRSFHPLPRRGGPRHGIVFVGTPTPRRLAFLSALGDMPLELWGPGWAKHEQFRSRHRADFIWANGLNELYNHSDIVLNLASWEPSRSGMTQRIAEVPASGAFLLTDDAPDLKPVYEPGVEVCTFTSPEHLRQQCEHYLAHPQERAAIAARGHERALTLPAFDQTARKLLEALA